MVSQGSHVMTSVQICTLCFENNINILNALNQFISLSVQFHHNSFYLCVLCTYAFTQYTQVYNKHINALTERLIIFVTLVDYVNHIV